VPFTRHAGGVVALFEQLGDGHFGGGKADGRIGADGAV
jgi:hypothetical protein